MSKYKTRGAVFIVSGVILVIFSFFALYVVPKMFAPPTKIYIGSGVFDTKLALDASSREKGLAGTNQLSPGEALLMVFDYESDWGIWMKDMKFPIDIIWLDETKKVVHIVKNASPEYSTNKTFKPNKPAKYVIELPAGTVDNNTINLNSLAIFQLEEVQ